MIEYWKKILKEIKAILLYFTKFKEDDIILPKDYLDNCVVKDSDWQPIIMIIHDKNIFFTNNSCWKVWTFKDYEILSPKRKRRV